jgi:hypothetical protein
MVPWILGSSWKDIISFYAIGTIFLAIAFMFSDFNEQSWVIIPFVMLAIDSGHGYLTAWRYVWKDPRDQRKAFWSFIAVFIFVITWASSGWPYLASFAVYSTIFHHYKQFHGILRWYQIREGDRSSTPLVLFKGMFFSSLLGLHFRDIKISFYGELELLLFPNETLYRLALLSYFVFFGSYLYFEFRDGRPSRTRLSAILIPNIIQGICFFLGQGYMQIAAPLLLIHGVSYWALLAKSINVESRARLNFKIAASLCAITLLIGGAWEFFWNQMMDSRYLFVAIAFVTTPVLWHAWMDASLWRSRDKNTQRIFFS